MSFVRLSSLPGNTARGIYGLTLASMCNYSEVVDYFYREPNLAQII